MNYFPLHISYDQSGSSYGSYLLYLPVSCNCCSDVLCIVSLHAQRILVWEFTFHAFTFGHNARKQPKRFVARKMKAQLIIIQLIDD